MKLVRKYNIPSQIIYDGVYDKAQIFKEYEINISDTFKAYFCLSDTADNSFNVLLENLNEKDRVRLLSEDGLKNTPPAYWKSRMTESDFNAMKFDYYKQDYGLPVKYILKNDLVFIYTYGEKQPSRWILVLESIWQISNTPS